MKMMSKTFPKLQIFLVFFLFFLCSCQKKQPLTIEKEQFIEIYSRLLIINEMKIKKDSRDTLIQKLYSEIKITHADFDSSISYYNSNPGEWVDIYNKIREKIQEIKNDFRTNSSLKIDSLSSKTRKNLPENSYRKTYISDDEKKELMNRYKKSEDEKNKKLKQKKAKSD